MNPSSDEPTVAPDEDPARPGRPVQPAEGPDDDEYTSPIEETGAEETTGVPTTETT